MAPEVFHVQHIVDEWCHWEAHQGRCCPQEQLEVIPPQRLVAADPHKHYYRGQEVEFLDREGRVRRARIIHRADSAYPVGDGHDGSATINGNELTLSQPSSPDPT
jgi:hypothetical protein